MTKHLSRKRRSQTKSKTMRRGQRGGDLGGNPPSAWGWGTGTLGGGWTQFMNSLTLQPGQNLGGAQSNAIVPVNNLNAQTSQGNIGPGMGGDIPSQSGGKRRKSRGRRGRRGGNIGAIVGEAALPAALMAGLYYTGKRTSSRRHRRR